MTNAQGLIRERHGAMIVWAPPGARPLQEVLGCVADPDWVLARADCEIVKYDGKVWVGRVRTPAGVVYVKRYARGVVRTALEGLVVGSPARCAARAAVRLRAEGIGVPDVCAAVEVVRAGVVTKSFFVTREVPDSETLDQHWARVRGQGDRCARRTLATCLGKLFARLHARGVYHNDLKDVNVMVRASTGEPELTLLDLERVRMGGGPLGRRRRVKNLVQLDRTLGASASRTDRLRMLRAYLGAGADRAVRRAWAIAVLRAGARKGRGKTSASTFARADVSCAIVCQDEAAKIAACLAGVVGWCGEVVVVDGGSRDDTVAIARATGARVIEHAWPGYRAQKQFAFDHATRPWVLSIDADERVTPELGQALQRLVAVVPGEVAGVAIARLVPYLGRWWFRGGWYPRHMPRLVRRDRARWGGVDPHDKLEVSGRVVRLRTPLLHYTYASIADHVRSVGRLTAVAVRQLPPARRAGAARLVGEPLWRFVRSYVVKRGALEGTAGLFVAATDAFYVFLRWASVWARRREVT
jgi:tRNA A-37 threonylcarbamoyl transferase component Bud32